ncbi:MAG: murein biosynthesis integral membrane protein MurJ [Intrasporangium sp.]|uniref:murein biosynthesis integral membrane protein MurJ n=1 Tax=Intrasporangium sp. TaxID=1925024 RepID=UPI002647BFC5|nr:murein biosynthesis integral membrane protein MurJ [Intrasporangium sp.]MDN5794509.1 murein biosynthesis integral membrane protein MurJ [Intrasporangium sp.]
MADGSLARSSLVMLGGSFASRVLGVVRGALLTAIIGTLAAGDAFGLANTLPNVLYLLAAGGILNAVLVPALSRAMRLQDGGQEFTDRVVTVALAGMLGLTAVVMFGAGFFVWLLSGGRGPEFNSLALAFTLMCLPQVFFYGVYALLGQILNARDRFGAFAWAPFVANVVAIGGLVAFMVIYPDPSHVDRTGQHLPRPPEAWTGGMVWLFAGTATLSVAAQALWLVPALRRAGFTYRPRWGLRGVGLGGVSRLALWAFAGLAVSQLGFFINTAVLNRAASFGTATHPIRGPLLYQVAFTIFMLPHAFIAVSIITALFPRLSRNAADQDTPAMLANFRRGLTLPLVANLPVVVFMIIGAGPIVALLNPGIDAVSIELGGYALTVMVLGIIPFGIDLLCYRTFFALNDGRSPLVMQVVLTAVTALAAAVTYLTPPQWALGVVAAGMTVGNVLSSGTGLILLRRRLGPLGLSRVLVSAARIGVAAVVAGLLGWGAFVVVSPIAADLAEMSTSQRVFANALVLGLSGLVFVVVYLAVAAALHVSEVREVGALVRRKAVRNRG